MGAWQWLCRAEGQTSTCPANPLCPSQRVERPPALTQPAQSPARDTQEPLTLSQATLTALRSLCQPFPCPGLFPPSGPSFSRSSRGYIPLNWMLSSQVALILPRSPGITRDPGTTSQGLWPSNRECPR